jgi:hypothetical protein
MGEKGFEQFWETHRCNAVCQFLGLPPINPKLEAEDNGTAVRDEFKSTAAPENVACRACVPKVGSPSGTSTHLAATMSMRNKDRWRLAIPPDGVPPIREHCWKNEYLVEGAYLDGISSACGGRHCRHQRDDEVM